MAGAASELRRCALAGALLLAAGRARLRRRCIAAAVRLEGGEFYSATARVIMARYAGVRIGAYSYGECFVPGSFPRGAVIGRYVSVAPGVRVFGRNHPMERLSMHPFFYNSRLGFVPEDTIGTAPLVVGHDAWIGERAIVTPGCRSIGIGAVIGAGAVVTKSVPDFGIVAGNPAGLVRHRFDEETRRRILDSRWWERSVEECVRHLPDMIVPVPDEPGRHPLLGASAHAGHREVRA